MINRYDYWSLCDHSTLSIWVDLGYRPISIIFRLRRCSSRWVGQITIRGPSDLTISSLLSPKCAVSSSLRASISRNGRRAIRSCWIRCCCSIWIRRSCSRILCRILCLGFSDVCLSLRQQSGQLKEGCLFRCLLRHWRRNCCLYGLLCSLGYIYFRNRTFASIFHSRFLISSYLMIFIRICIFAFYWTITFYALFSLNFYDVYKNLSWICKLDGIYTVKTIYFLRSSHHKDNNFLFIWERLWKIT